VGLASLAVGQPLVATLAIGLTASYMANNVLVSQVAPLIGLPEGLVAIIRSVIRYGSLAAILAVVAAGWYWMAAHKQAARAEAQP
jgi:hypothetical protein